jgi:hypothetical protein
MAREERMRHDFLVLTICTHAPPEFTTYNITSHKGGFYSVLGRGATPLIPFLQPQFICHHEQATTIRTSPFWSHRDDNFFLSPK